MYVVGERTGGSPDEWGIAEAKLLASLDELAQQGLLAPAALEKAGLTLLARSASLGCGFAVARLMKTLGAAKALDQAVAANLAECDT